MHKMNLAHRCEWGDHYYQRNRLFGAAAHTRLFGVWVEGKLSEGRAFCASDVLLAKQIYGESCEIKEIYDAYEVEGIDSDSAAVGG